MAMDRAAARAAAKEQLRNRVKESYERKDSWGVMTGFFRPDKKIPFWWPGQGQHTVDIIPFIAGNNMPKHMGVKEGEWCVNLDIWAHYDVGPGKATLICPKMNYGKRCPVCEERDRLKSSETSADLKEFISKVTPSRRSVYNVVVLDTDKDKDRGVQVWDASHHSIHKEIEAQAVEEGSVQIYYADMEEGYSIRFTREGQSQYNTKYRGFKLLKREYAISDEHIDQAQTLDQIIHVPTYEEMCEVFFGGISSTSEDPVAVGQDTPRPSETPTEESPKKEAVASVPPRRQAPAQAAPRETAPPPRRQAPAPQETPPVVDKATCPYNHPFGEVEKHEPDCSTCDSWEDCAAKAEEIRKAAQSSPSSRRRG